MSRVLLAEDDANFRNALETVLGAAGHHVTTTGSGLEAVSLALSLRPELIISDIHMPVFEGPKAVRMIRAVPGLPAFSVIFMSGEATASDAPGATFLRKPFDPSLLLAAIERLAVPRLSAVSTRPGPPEDLQIAPERESRRLSRRSAEVLGVRVTRAFELMTEQAVRIADLQEREAETGLAADLYVTLLGSYAVLRQLQLAATASGAGSRSFP